MTEIGIDIETYSSEDLTKCGVYRYAEAPDFEVLLFAYSVDGGPVRCVDIARGEVLPSDIREAMTDPAVTKTAFNAAFERICLSRYLGIPYMDPSQWKCTMVRALRLGFPPSLAGCGEALGLQEGKMKEGRDLILRFSKLYRGKRIRPEDEPEKWELFKAYNVRDVEVEQAILAKVRRLEAPDWDEELYNIDQRINDRGVLTDLQLVGNAIKIVDEYNAEILEEAKQITGLENPNSPTQLKEWIQSITRMSFDTLRKADLDTIEKKTIYYPQVQRMLQIRRELGKTSLAKYTSIQNCVCKDGRIRGLLQFYGAARSGRWAGRLVQLQNLPQNHLKDIDLARRVIRRGDYETAEIYFSNIPQVVSELIRTAFVARPGRIFHVCDFSAIEARVIAWLAKEEWVLDVFRGGGDIYCATASQMFHVPVEKHGQNAELRQKGKVAVLALGYGGGVAALEAMGGAKMGLSEMEMKEIVALWRKANPRIVSLWRDVEECAMNAISHYHGRSVFSTNGITFQQKWGALLITLPSGRSIAYPRAHLETIEAQWGGMKTEIVYEGLNQASKKWGEIRTWGGKLVENIVQAIARDVLGSVMLQCDKSGFDIVFHVHDEIIVEAASGQTLEQIEAIFSQNAPWNQGLPLRGAGYSTPYYLKD